MNRLFSHLVLALTLSALPSIALADEQPYQLLANAELSKPLVKQEATVTVTFNGLTPSNMLIVYKNTYKMKAKKAFFIEHTDPAGAGEVRTVGGVALQSAFGISLPNELGGEVAKLAPGTKLKITGIVALGKVGFGFPPMAHLAGTSFEVVEQTED